MPREQGPLLPALSDCLWACDLHTMIGTEEQAKAHGATHGCVPRELSQEESDGVRAEWDKQRAERVAGYLSYARLIGGRSS